MGVTVIQPALIEAELASGQLVIPFKQAAITDRGYYLCSRSALSGNGEVELLSKWLLQEAKASISRCMTLQGLKPAQVTSHAAGPPAR
jgi:LysR family transcriptional regulator, glycine cleavage system transcriptional activator